MIAYGQPGSDFYFNIRLRISTGVYINIDDLAEMYIFITDEYKNVIQRYSKAGGTLNGYTYTALSRTDENNYYQWVDSANTKNIQSKKLFMEINYVQTEAELTDNKANSIGVGQIIELGSNVIKIIS